MTRPAAAAWIGVPVGTPMSMPGWKPPQRGPNGLVIGPLTGQMNWPDPDGGGLAPALAPPLEDEAPASAACAARIRAASCALTAARAFDSPSSARIWARVAP